MMFPLYSYWITFADSYLSVYPIAAIISIILYLFIKSKWKYEVNNWLYVFNTIALWITFINFAFYVSELFIAWYGQNPYEWYTFSYNRINIFSLYGWSFWLMMFCTLLLPQLFWFKRLRRNIVFTFMLAFLLSVPTWLEHLVIFITSAYRDYLPSSWSTYQDVQKGFFLQLFLNLICFIIVSFFTYWLLYKRKKLPFLSAILSYSLFFISYSSLLCIQNFN